VRPIFQKSSVRYWIICQRESLCLSRERWVRQERWEMSRLKNDRGSTCYNHRKLSEIGAIGRELRQASIRQRSVTISSKVSVWRPIHRFKWCLTLFMPASYRPPKCGRVEEMPCRFALVASRLRKFGSQIALACASDNSRLAPWNVVSLSEMDCGSPRQDTKRW